MALNDEGVPQDSDSPVEASHKRAGLFDDPVVKGLAVALGVIVILFLSTVLAALYLGVLGSDVPRTARDRDLQAYEYQTKAGTQDPKVWRSYVGVLIESGQLRRAQQVVDQGIQVIDNKPGADMTFAQAEIYFESEKYDKAIETATKGMAALIAYNASQAKIEKTPESKGEPVSENYWGMLYIRANSYVKLGEFKKALADFDDYIEERGGAADVLVLRGDVKAEVGDKKGAEADYRQALKFIEDNEAAKEGLKKLGVKQ